MSDVDRRGPVDVGLLRLIPALRIHLVVAALVAAAIAVAVVVQAEALARALTDLVADGDISRDLGSLMLVLVSVALARGAATAVTEWSSARAMRALRADIRTAVLDHAALEADRTSGGLASREAMIATTGVDQLEPYVRQFLPALFLAVAVPLVAGVRILFADLLSAVLIALTVPLIPVFMVLIGRMTERRTARQWAVLQRLGGHFLDVIEGMPTLRLFGRAEAQREAVHRVSEQYRSTTMNALRIAFLSALALELIATLSVALIAVEIGLRLAGGGLDLGTALVVLLLTPECYLPLRRVGASFHAAQSGLDASDDLHALLSRPTLRAGDRPAPATGALELRAVTLHRGGRVIVAGLDLDVAPGTVTAVYGPSGIGKSTLIEACRGRLLERSGSLAVDRIDLSDLDPASWADQLAVIGQRLAPDSSPVADEVRAATAAPEEMIRAALAEVGLADLAERPCDELSGGQLRRVQVASALVAVRSGRARFVLADEPTAHLDAANAGAVWRALADLAHTNGAAVLVATHDPGCRSMADQVIDLEALNGDARDDSATDGLRSAAPSIGGASDASGTATAARSPTIALTPVDATVSAEHGSPQSQVVSAAEPHELRSSLRRILTIARPARGRFVGAAALGTAAEVCTIGLAGAAAWLIMRAAEQPDLAALSIAILAVRAFGTGKGVFRYAERLATHDTGLRSLSEIRAAVVARLAEIAPAGIPGWQRGDLLQRVVADVDRLLDLFVRVLGPLVAVAITALGVLVITVVLDPAAGLVLLVALVVVGVVIPAVTVTSEATVGPALTDERARLGDRVLGLTERIDQRWADRRLPEERRGIDNSGGEIEKLESRRARVRMATGAAVTAAPLLTAAATLAAVATISGSLSGPVIGVLVLWPLAVLELVGTTNEAWASVPSVAGAARRVVAVLDTPDPAAPADETVAIGPRPDVLLDAVRARWPGADIDALAEVTIDIPAGSHVVVTGPSGSGKSTLAAVLVGFCAPRSGRYRIGPTSVEHVSGRDLRHHITWIQQLPWLADTTVRENLRIALPDADDDELVAALHSVRLDDWFGHLPAGLDARIGRGGAGMSGGEAQRLALARVLLAGHDVVVLDEPTAHLDAATAQHVLDTVLDRCNDRSTILLTHEWAPLPPSPHARAT